MKKADPPTCCDACQQYYTDIGGADKALMMRCFSAKQHASKKRARPPPPPHIWDEMSLGSDDEKPAPAVFRAAPMVELKQKPLRSETEPGWWKRKKT